MDDLKKKAAEAALDYVEEGMKVGLGTGSTAALFIQGLAERLKDGLNVVCVPTSEESKKQAEELNIPLTTLDDEPQLDLTVDGADEVSEELILVKGGGGALLREKIVAMASEQVIIIADESKLVKDLGKFPLPIEVVQFGLGSTKKLIGEFADDIGCKGEISLRTDSGGKHFVSDNGNFILDCHFGKIEDPVMLDELLSEIPGVVTTGLFVGLADSVILGGREGLKVLEFQDDMLDEFGDKPT